ncbi:MAG: transporter substrate-binding domain-containing protein [bacterium]|nr:transporter substrate-binding domain-containing protein [bacterium]
MNRHLPALQFYAHHGGKGRVNVVGKTFSPQDFGFAVSAGSRLREDLNRALLELRETGQMEIIRSKWFGK